MPDGTIFVEFLPEAHFDFVDPFPAGAEGETADVDGAEVDPEPVRQRLHGGGGDRFEFQLCGRLAEHPGTRRGGGSSPESSWNRRTRLFKADFGGGGVVAFEKLGFIPGLSGRENPECTRQRKLSSEASSSFSCANRSSSSPCCRSPLTQTR